MTLMSHILTSVPPHDTLYDVTLRLLLPTPKSSLWLVPSLLRLLLSICLNSVVVMCMCLRVCLCACVYVCVCASVRQWRFLSPIHRVVVEIREGGGEGEVREK